ncbi:MAG TPA: bifunctional 4-hydroxy-2-oxoglutarate aldolase/2-dehydro-3-deoxy-phosphogluconate aldolase [Polyangiaceae bacterium]|jgi:2-dehydro-3-deoxyphosphogluconate aldolase/(4S)-4-hydroxy-2-oxoglutarate aldolase|nr:bifunctional 4-hydroxy-2-oxoglutarate aldolase/2-dehydro-3-deoxy-phosphogluconate aldolase [Polyangiaceae bacterium]
MNRVAICRRIEHTGIVPVVRAESAEQALLACRALKAGGVDVLEITLTVPDAPQLIRTLAHEFPDTLIGAGTVTDSKQARACLEAGAEFVVSPGFDPEIVALCHEAEKPALPGAITPSEIMGALRSGADIIKLFPASALGGAKYLKSLRGPFPYVRFLPTGGVNASTARDYIAAGAVALGVGSELVDVVAIERREFETIAARTRELIRVVREARQEQRAQRSRVPRANTGGAA